ncbi:YoaK family protein [Planctomyces sp. SH-PL14]|uniref:YoaK family protein n=1 Tax=Planctomyces sp. SH-PL14 TaxID=1632864 RepID=UPI00078D78D2|nr:YoaK family protein [Planctomyces sp. SH-PL14]AMV19193.1 hypothetical protein VT03_14985 [Planctomyces sp. SH-PL14]
MKITLHTPETIYSPRHAPSWLLLACAAGMVNGFAFLMCEQFVTHVTGTVTRMGLEWPVVGVAIEYAVVVVSFVLGAAVAVIVIQSRARQGKQPRWATPLVLVVVLLVSTAIAGRGGAFGQLVRTAATEPPPVAFLSLLAFTMGLQNSAVASTTGLAVRTTHLSGPATDTGMHLGTAILADGEERRAALRGAALRGGKILAFMLGAGVAVPLTLSLDYFTLLAPAILVSVATALSFTSAWSPSDIGIR